MGIYDARPILGLATRQDAETHVPPKPLVLKLSDQKVLAAVRDFRTMQRWEVLRRRHGPASAQEFAAACSATYEEAVASLDLLLEGGFVLRRKATAKCRHVTFEAAAETILVAFDSTDEAQREWINSQRREIRRICREAVDSRLDQGRPAGPRKQYVEVNRVASLTQDEAARATVILQSAFDAIREIEREAEARSLRRASEGQRTAHGEKVAEVAEIAEDESRYVLTASIVPVGAAFLPFPSINFIDEGLAARRFDALASDPEAILTQHELRIARRLAAGASRPAVAKALGLSINTIASASKRIYAKLGVHTRAEFAARMARVATPGGRGG